MDSILEVKELEAIKGHRICDDPFHSRDRIEARQTNLYHLQFIATLFALSPFLFAEKLPDQLPAAVFGVFGVLFERVERIEAVAQLPAGQVELVFPDELAVDCEIVGCQRSRASGFLPSRPARPTSCR